MMVWRLMTVAGVGVVANDGKPVPGSLEMTLKSSKPDFCIH